MMVMKRSSPSPAGRPRHVAEALEVAEGEPSQHLVKPFSILSLQDRCVLLLQLELFEFVSRAENSSQAEWSSCRNLNYRICPIESRRSPEHLYSV